MIMTALYVAEDAYAKWLCERPVSIRLVKQELTRNSFGDDIMYYALGSTQS